MHSSGLRQARSSAARRWSQRAPRIPRGRSGDFGPSSSVAAEYLPVYGGEAVRHEGAVIGRLRSVAFGPDRRANDRVCLPAGGDHGGCRSRGRCLRSAGRRSRCPGRPRRSRRPPDARLAPRSSVSTISHDGLCRFRFDQLKPTTSRPWTSRDAADLAIVAISSRRRPRSGCVNPPEGASSVPAPRDRCAVLPC